VFVENKGSRVGSDAARLDVRNAEMGTRENANEGKTQRHRMTNCGLKEEGMLRIGTQGENLVFGEGRRPLG
jgi:hypothetical protein